MTAASAALVARGRAVSLNGADNVGKTTALAWLASAADDGHFVSNIDKWHPGWKTVARENFARWWFVDSTTPEHVELVMASHQARRRASGPLGFEDRGTPMLLATCAATCAVKEGLTPAVALDRVTALAAPLAPQPREELHILLRHCDDGPAAEAGLALSRQPRPPTGPYVAYQQALAQVLEIQAHAGAYDEVLVRGEDSVLGVQRRLRAVLAEYGVGVRPLPEATPRRVWALGGMSECGKSTVGELLAAEHGATRLKIGYLLQLAALRAGVASPYAWDEREQATRLVEEILEFCAANKADTVSVESLHRFVSAQHLRRCLGPICQIVYIDTDPAIRAARTREEPASLAQRDAIKTERGAHRIREIADIVVDNNGPLSTLKLALPALVAESPVDPHRPIPTWAPQSCQPWLAEISDHLLGGERDRDGDAVLLLATGSTGTRSWRPQWSDVDLLLVRDRVSLDWQRTVAASLPRPAGLKVGLSVVTTGEIAAGLVPSRVLRALRIAADGTGVLFRRAGYVPPVPTAVVNDQASRANLGQVLITTRRLLAEPTPNTRALHKHLVLIAKVLLRADGHQVDDADGVLATFAEHHPGAGVTPLRVADIAASNSARPDDPTAATGVRQLLHAVAAAVDYPDRIIRTLDRRTT